MAAEADIQVPVPVCETGVDQVGNFVDNIINISVSKLSLEKHTRDDQQNEHPTVGENFLRPPLTGEVHSEVNNASPEVSKVIEEPNQAEGAVTLLLSNKLDGQPVEVTADEDKSMVEIQQSGEESNTMEKNGDNGTDSSVVIPEMVENKLDDCGAGLVTRQSNDTGSDQQGTYDSITENITLNKEIVHETSLPSEETESQATLTSQSEEKPIEEGVLCDLKSEGSKEGESDQCKTTSEEEKRANERIGEDNSNAAAEEVIQGSTLIETAEVLETSHNDEVKSKSDLNSSFSKEEENIVQNGDKISTASENSGVPLENTLSENHGDEECQSKNLDNDATDHSIPTLEEKSEEISLVKVHNSQIEYDKHLEEEKERLPLTEVSMGDTNDNVPPATHDVKDKDDDLIKAELSENEPSTRCLSVEDDRQKETTADTLLVAAENTEASNLSQENSIQGHPEEQSTIEAKEATIDAVDAEKESLESCQPIVSSSPKEGSMSAVLREQEVTNDHVEVLENLSLGEGHTEINNVAPNFTEDTEEPDQTARDGKVDFDVNEETSLEEIQPNAEESNSTAKEDGGGAVPEQCSADSSVMTSKEKAGDALNDPSVDGAGVVSQLSKDTSIDQHGTNDSCNENIALSKEILEETNIPSAETESQTPCTREVEEQNVPVETADQSQDEKTTEEEISCDLRSEVSKEEESDQCKMASEPEVLANERSVEDNTNTAAEESLGSGTPIETMATIEASNDNELQSKSELNSLFSTDEETTVQNGDKIEDSGVPSGNNTLSESHGDEECQSKNLEYAAADHSYPKLEGKSENSSLVQTEDSKVKLDEQLGEESEKLPLTDVSGGANNDNLSPVTDIVKDEDGDLKEAELSELDARYISEKEDRQIETHAESLVVAPRDIEVSTLSQENSIKDPAQEQNTEAALHGSINEVEEATIDAVDQQKESSESFPPIVSSSPEEGSMNAVLQEVTSDSTDEKIIDEVDKQAEVLENLTIGEVHSEINDNAPEIIEVAEKPDQQVEFAADEEMSTEEIQQNVEDGDRGVVTEQCNTESLVVTSEVKARDTLDDLDEDEARVVNQLSKDTSSNEQDDSFTKNISVTKEILEETNIPSEEIESQAPCIADGEELNLQLQTTENKYEDEKPTEEDKSSNLTSEVPKEGESDQNKTSEKEVFTSVEENFNNAAEDVSQENSTSAETITTLGASTSNELESRSDFISSFSKEDETTVENGDSSVTKSEDHGVPLENRLRENHGDVECPLEILEDAATDHSDSRLAEKFEESSLDQIENSQVECDEHLKVESEGLPLTEASTEGTHDNASEAIDKVKDEGKDLKEDIQIEHTAESSQLAPKCIEESDLDQEDKIKGPLKEQSTNADLHGNTTEEQGTAISEGVDQLKESLEGLPPIVSSSSEEESSNAALKQVTCDHTNDIIEEVDKHEEVLENVSTTISTENTEGKNSLIELEGSEDKKEDELGKESEETPSPLPLAREVGNESKIFQESQYKDEELTKAEFCNTERSTESVLQKMEPRTVNTEDISNVNSEDNKTPVLSRETETSSVSEEKDISKRPEGILDKRPDCGTVDETEVKEDSLEDVATEIPHKYIKENSVTQVDCSEREDEEHLEKNNQNPSLKEATIEETHSMDCVSEKLKEADLEKHADSLQVKHEDVKQHDSSLDMNNSIKEEIPDTDPQEISSNNTEKEPINAVNTNEESLEAKGMSKSNLDCDKDDTNEEVSRKNTEEKLIKDEESIESLQVTAKDIEATQLGQDTETCSLDEQSTISNTEAEAHEKKKDIADNANGSEHETPKDKDMQQIIANTTLYEDKEENLQLREDCLRLEQYEDLGNDGKSTPFTEAPKVYTTESSTVKEEQVEKHVEEQITTADPQETCELENVVYVAAEKHASLEDFVVNVPNGDNGDSSLNEVDGSRDPSSEEAPAEAINDDEPTVVHETNLQNENTAKANLFEEEQKIESALTKEEVCLESLQAADEDIATSSVQEREASHLEDQAPTTDSQGTSGDQKDGKTIHLADVKEEIVEDKTYAATPCGDTSEDSPIPVDGSLLEQQEQTEKDNESTTFAFAPKDTITESIPVVELAQVEDPIHSSKVDTKDIKVFASCQETEISSGEMKILDPEDVLSGKITEKTIQATGEETQEAKGAVKDVPHEEDSPNVEDGSQKPSLVEGSMGNIDEHESTTMHEVKFMDESLIKADLMENEENTKATLIKEDVSIELPQVVDEDINDPCLNEARETNSQGEQILNDQTDFQKENPKDEEKSLNLTAEKTPSAEDLAADEGIIGRGLSNCGQREPSITEVSEEQTAMRNEHASDNTTLESEVSKKNNDGANTCDDKTDSEKIEVSNDGSIAVSTNETRAETDSIGSTEAEVQAPNGEKDEELSTKEAEIDQKNIKETQLYNASEYVSELERVDEAKMDSNNCDEISGSSNYVASQEVSTSNEVIKEDLASNSSQETRRETSEEAEIEEPQDSSMENIERDAQSCLASANDSGITQMEVPIHVREENIIETANGKEGDVVEGATNDEGIGHLEQADTTKSYSNDKKPIEEVLEDTVANDKLPVSPSKISEVDHCSTERELTNKEDPCTEKTASGNDEKEARDEKISDISFAAPDTTQTRDIDVVKLTNNSDNIIDNTEGPLVNENTSVECILDNERSATYLETNNDDEATEIKETTPSDAECQDLKSANVEENSNYPGSLSEEKSNSDEVALAPGENKSVYVSNNQELESVAQTDKPVAENTSEQEETMSQKEILKDDISGEKEQSLRIKAEDEDIKDDQGSCEEEVVGNSHQEHEVKQEQQKISKETTEFKEDVSEVSEEAKDKAPEDQEEKILTNETIDGILHEEEHAKSIEELTNKTDTLKAQELAIASVKADAEDSNKEENIVFSEGKSEADAKEANTWTKSIESSGSEDIAGTEQASEAIIVTTEVQEVKVGIDLGVAVPKSTGIESQEVEEVSDTCAAIEATSTPAEPPVISTSKIIPEWTEGTPLESEDKQTKLHNLQKELDIKDSEVKMSEKDDVVNLQSVRDINKDVQELSKDSFEVSNNENLVDGDPEELIEANEGKETKSAQNAPILEALEQATEEKQLGGIEDVHEEEKKINSTPNQLESTYGTESGICYSSVDDMAQHEKGEGQQIDSLPSLSQAPCSDIKTSEKDLLVLVPGSGGIDVAELEASPLPSKDKHVVLEVDDARNSNHENPEDNKNISTEYSQGEHVIDKPCKVEQEAECGNEERTDQKMEEKPEPTETGKSSLSDLFQVSMREHTQVADHSATGKEPTSQTGDLCAENSDEAEHENSKMDEEKDEEEESHEQQKSDSVSEAPVMVDMGDADVKVAHKKSHNILSGVGSKVKHSIAKVKKVITGKSSHPKPPSPKKAAN